MSSVDAALPDISGAGVGFTRVPTGMFTAAKWKLYEWLHEQGRHNPKIQVTDRWLAEKFGVTREWINECLRWLERLGVIVRDRIGQHGRRLITFKVPFAKPKPKNPARSRPKGASVEQPQAAAKPAVEENPERGPEIARDVLDVLRAKGWTLTVNEDRNLVPTKLRDDADPNDVGNNVRLLIKNYKADIIALLEAARE
jgi:DNA-binding Lrp family transcriptional regulator